MDEIIIEPDKTVKHIGRELWQYRELFLFLSWRDILVRYKQTVIGIAWSVLRPLLMMIVFTIVFGKLAKLPSGDIPYPLLVYAAMRTSMMILSPTLAFTTGLSNRTSMSANTVVDVIKNNTPKDRINFTCMFNLDLFTMFCLIFISIYLC